ncbi:MAG: internal scaffolding protein [Microviridae sp.]|nr:MAG: internal scaffolding protein [Microviridae sp.]
MSQSNHSPSTQTLNDLEGSLPLVISAYGPYKLSISQSFDPSLDRTKQSDKDSCDINLIMARYIKTGVLDFVNKNAASYGDITGIDFQTSMDTVAKAKTMFDQLPAELREQFDNNPGFFCDFVSNEENLPEMAEMGLLTPEAAFRVLNPQPAPEAPKNASNPVV